MAGVPFEAVGELATLETAAAGRKLHAAKGKYASAKEAVSQLLASRKHDLSQGQFQAWRKAVRHGVMPAAADPSTSVFSSFWDAGNQLADSEKELGDALEREPARGRESLYRAAATYLPRYLIFAAKGVHDLMRELVEAAGQPTGPVPVRKKACALASVTFCSICSAPAEKTTP